MCGHHALGLPSTSKNPMDWRAFTCLYNEKLIAQPEACGWLEACRAPDCGGMLSAVGACDASKGVGFRQLPLCCRSRERRLREQPRGLWRTHNEGQNPQAVACTGAGTIASNISSHERLTGIISLASWSRTEAYRLTVSICAGGALGVS